MQMKLGPAAPSTVRYGKRGLALSLGLAVCNLSRLASAEQPTAEPAIPRVQEKLLCSQSFELAQRLRNDTRYLEANQELLKCANPKCGEALFQECSKLYAEVQTAIPSVIFEAHDTANGEELVDVWVSLDGHTLTKQLDGKPVLVDPGNHTFTFTASNGAPVDKSIVIRAGEKFRQILVALELHEPTRAPENRVEARLAPATRPSRASRRKPPVSSYVLGGVGVVGLGAFVALRVIGAGDYHTLDTSCAPNCAGADVDRVKQKYLFSNVALGVGAAALVGAIVLYAAQPRSKPETALVIGPSNGGFLARAVTRF